MLFVTHTGYRHYRSGLGVFVTKFVVLNPGDELVSSAGTSDNFMSMRASCPTQLIEHANFSARIIEIPAYCRAQWWLHVTPVELGNGSDAVH